MLRKKRLRSGYTTGACAAAAAKAATILVMCNALCARGTGNFLRKKLPVPLFTGEVVESGLSPTSIEIPFPDGTRVTFKVHSSSLNADDDSAFASVIKDAGDDPDVTNGAEIIATVRLKQGGDCPEFTGEAVESGLSPTSELIIKGGSGVGTVTKPGLPVPVGEPAINPVPRKMIQEAVMEALSESARCARRIGNFLRKKLPVPLLSPSSALEITISVTDGEKLAKKTLNSRLGIVGGISILGTTGIVRPISLEAWTATIASSMDVAKAMGHNEIVLSAGRASELAHMKKYKFPEESYVMMGDYLEFTLLEAKKHGFKKIHLCAQWAKMLKIAMAMPQTHVRHGALDTKKAVEFLLSLQPSAFSPQSFNTAREIFDFIRSAIGSRQSAIFSKVCSAAKEYAQKITGDMSVVSYLVSYEGEIIANSE